MPIPTTGDSNWGTALNNHLAVSINPTNGALQTTALQTANVVQSTTVDTIVSLTQVAYDALTPNANTFYIITA